MSGMRVALRCGVIQFFRSTFREDGCRAARAYLQLSLQFLPFRICFKGGKPAVYNGPVRFI